MAQGLSWFGIVRLGLVQTALGAIVVLTTATLNRVMVVELAMAAMLPGALVALHYGVQITRPAMGYGSDVAGRRTGWIIGGMAVLASGGFLAALGTVWMESDVWAGIALATLAFIMIGLGVGASGTSLLALLAKKTAPRRRAVAASMVWMMMIFGFIVTAIVAGAYLDPYSHQRLLAVTAVVSVAAFTLACVAVWGVERSAGVNDANDVEPGVSIEAKKTPFIKALKEIWAEPKARHFSVFVFVSMLAYSAQDLILEPFAGVVFGMTPGQSTQLSGVQHSGVFAGMLAVGILASGLRLGSLKFWTVAGCVVSATALAGLAFGGTVGETWPLEANVVALGFGNGVFAVAAIGSMMGLAGDGRKQREGTRMGLWGAAQALAFGLGGFVGTAAIDLTRAIFAAPSTAYGIVFAGEAALFLLSAILALKIGRANTKQQAADFAARVGGQA